MSTHILQNSTHAIVLDECSSWVERILVRAARSIATNRANRVRRARLQELGKLSARQLRDTGYDDPEIQRQLLGDYLETRGQDFTDINHRLQIRR